MYETLTVQKWRITATVYFYQEYFDLTNKVI